MIGVIGNPTHPITMIDTFKGRGKSESIETPPLNQKIRELVLA